MLTFLQRFAFLFRITVGTRHLLLIITFDNTPTDLKRRFASAVPIQFFQIKLMFLFDFNFVLSFLNHVYNNNDRPTIIIQRSLKTSSSSTHNHRRGRCSDFPAPPSFVVPLQSTQPPRLSLSLAHFPLIFVYSKRIHSTVLLYIFIYVWKRVFRSTCTRIAHTHTHRNPLVSFFGSLGRGGWLKKVQPFQSAKVVNLGSHCERRKPAANFEEELVSRSPFREAFLPVLCLPATASWVAHRVATFRNIKKKSVFWM